MILFPSSFLPRPMIRFLLRWLHICENCHLSSIINFQGHRHLIGFIVRFHGNFLRFFWLVREDVSADEVGLQLCGDGMKCFFGQFLVWFVSLIAHKTYFVADSLARLCKLSASTKIIFFTDTHNHNGQRSIIDVFERRFGQTQICRATIGEDKQNRVRLSFFLDVKRTITASETIHHFTRNRNGQFVRTSSSLAFFPASRITSEKSRGELITMPDRKV